MMDGNANLFSIRGGRKGDREEGEEGRGGGQFENEELVCGCDLICSRGGRGGHGHLCRPSLIIAA